MTIKELKAETKTALRNGYCDPLEIKLIIKKATEEERGLKNIDVICAMLEVINNEK